MTENPKDFRDFERSYSTELQRKRFNLAVVGMTGAGKSTLINAVFGQHVAEAGAGNPVTQHTSLYINSDGTLGLYDFKGIETGDSTRKIVKELHAEFQRAGKRRAQDQVHGVWFCVNSRSSRFDDGQQEIVEALARLNRPVFVVLTRVLLDGDRVVPSVRKLSESIRLRGLPIVNDGKPFYVNAVEDPETRTRVHGLNALVSATADHAVELARASFISAQRVDLQLKKKEAAKIWRSASVEALSVETSVLEEILGQMMRKIAAIYEVDADSLVVAEALRDAAIGLGSAASFADLLKAIPKIGDVAAAAAPAALTAALGWAWTETCQRIYTGELPTSALRDAANLGTWILKYLREWFSLSADAK